MTNTLVVQKKELLALNNELRELLISHCNVSIGNMELLEITEKIYIKIAKQSFNYGRDSAVDFIKCKLDTVIDDIQLIELEIKT